MHPGMLAWWRGRRGSGSCGSWAHAAWGAVGAAPGGAAGDPLDTEAGGGSFGVRRPLRFLAFKLDLSHAQVAELARILDELKTERAQAAVDERRTLGGLAEAVEAEAWDPARAQAAAAHRLRAAEALRDAVVRALGRIHAVLDPAQRARLAYLIRTGQLLL